MRPCGLPAARFLLDGLPDTAARVALPRPSTGHWSASTFEVLALASRAFAFYYLLQCLVAISVSRSSVQRAGMALLAAALGFITVFAVPAG